MPYRGKFFLGVFKTISLANTCLSINFTTLNTLNIHARKIGYKRCAKNSKCSEKTRGCEIGDLNIMIIACSSKKIDVTWHLIKKDQSKLENQEGTYAGQGSGSFQEQFDSVFYQTLVSMYKVHSTDQKSSSLSMTLQITIPNTTTFYSHSCLLQKLPYAQNFEKFRKRPKFKLKTREFPKVALLYSGTLTLT